MKYTPGPWKISGHKGLFVEPLGVQSCHNEWGSNGNSIIGQSEIYTKRTIKEAQANARLMAAAPDLLEALEQIADDKGNADFTINEIKQIAQNAIAKAKGVK